MKHGSANSLRSQIGSQLSEQQRVKAVKSDQRCKHQQAKFWSPYFGMHKVFCSSITLRKEEPSIANIIQHYWCFWRKKLQKNPATNEEKSALLLRQCIVLQVDCYDHKTTWIALWLASTTTLFYFSPVCRPQKNAPGKEIWLQWRSDTGKWDVFWDQRQIVLQKRHQIVREALESVYHPRGDYVDE